MKSKKDNAWYDKDIVPSEMVKGAKAEIPGWKKLEYTDHFKVLDESIKSIDVKSIVDIGCGAAEIGRLYDSLEYLGVDLHHVIEGVAKVVNPNLEYLQFDANESSFDFLENYDLVLMNGFLSEMPDPIEILESVLSNSLNYVIIHRQDFTDSLDTFIRTYNSYGGIQATNSVINLEEFKIICHKYGFCITIKDSNLGGKKTILLQKIKAQ